MYSNSNNLHILLNSRRYGASLCCAVRLVPVLLDLWISPLGKCLFPHPKSSWRILTSSSRVLKTSQGFLLWAILGRRNRQLPSTWIKTKTISPQFTTVLKILQGFLIASIFYFLQEWRHQVCSYRGGEFVKWSIHHSKHNSIKNKSREVFKKYWDMLGVLRNS